MTMRPQRHPRSGRARLGIAGVLATALLAAACGGGDTAGDGDGPTSLSVATIPTPDAASIYLAEEQGFFEEEDLDVDITLADSGGAIIPGVVRGDYQFGHSNTVSLAVAAGEGLPLQAVTNTTGTGSDPDQDISRILVAGDSPIQDAADLAGTTIAVNGLNNIGEVTIKAALENRGVDVSGLDFVEMPYPDMNAALFAGEVDAIWQLEPHLSLAEEDGARPVLSNFVEATPDAQLGYLVTNRQYAAENTEVIERFSRAMDRAKEFATDNPDETRRVLTESLGIPAEQAQDMLLPVFQPGMDVDSLRTYLELTERYGLISEQPNADDLVAPGANTSETGR
ncbi:nitrate ABC transporter substrate-binding protein [Actinoalloteichus sp. AHMU CJ021]|uniref:NitT/TauT family transport system substrate-binding protein n=1 Tax=Actinoalloteichus caeruleus DSM 43889 TaxID=1120930 RepID=A0ABT1JHF3_ACTCY|nr:ABC transporter substrate-binding protein [Actinoalloteichus caeruleus]AUS77710.1 nitrate ABC transporter substrate-binding protein [Actinoalloteichus sp. AHMU CJ021]MCP2331634.1 NitT/TauT family transport system substrate-binding protein [Actinoalloteichus caeruleus DSM 43889]